MINKEFGKRIDIKSKYPYKKVDKEIYKCSLCGYTSKDSTNFENDVCLMCLRIHDIDY